MNIVKMTFTRILFFLLLFAYSSHISSQIQFCTSQKDLGTIQANGDIFKVDYTFKNESTQPVAIARIASSCGCTIPSFDKRPIQAGQSGHILVSFNPTGINGFFKKQISVYFSGSTQPVHLYLSGKVIPTPHLRPGYHYAIGDLQFRNVRSSLKASTGQTTMRTFPLLNTSQQALKVTLSCSIKGISFEKNEFTLSPEERQELVVYFSPDTSQTIRIRITGEQADKQKVALKIIPDL